MNPTAKKKELMEKFKSRPKFEKIISFKDLKIDIHPDTFKWYRESR